MFLRGSIAASLVLCAAPVMAQTTTAALRVGTPVAPQSGPVLRTGTPVAMKLSEELSTKEKQLRSGQRFHLETAAPVIVDGITVIPLGTPAEGEITEVRNKGMWGKSGRFSAHLLYLTVNGRQIRLTGNMTEKGSSGGLAAVGVAAVVFAPAGFL